MEWMCLDFINSDWRDWRGSGRRANRLADADWRDWFAQKWALPQLAAPDAAGMAALLALREAMRRMIESLNAGEPFAGPDMDTLNAALAAAPHHMRLRYDDGILLVERVTKAQGWTEASGKAAASFAEMVTTEDSRRVKICDNEDCRWVFFDESRSRTKRWCDDKCCGNLLKVRRFRERRKGLEAARDAVGGNPGVDSTGKS